MTGNFEHLGKDSGELGITVLQYFVWHPNYGCQRQVDILVHTST